MRWETLRKINELIEFIDKNETHEYYEDKIEDIVEKINEIIRCVNCINDRSWNHAFIDWNEVKIWIKYALKLKIVAIVLIIK